MPLYRKYSLVINQLPKIYTHSFLKRYAYAPYISIMKKYNKSFYILTDSFIWNGTNIFIVNFVMADNDYKLFYDYDLYPSIKPIQSI